MDAFLDTSVLVATFCGEHEHDDWSIRADAQILYTWNIKHLARLGEQVAARLSNRNAPPDLTSGSDGCVDTLDGQGCARSNAAQP